jgi:outer membrane protein assembly factor BamB
MRPFNWVCAIGILLGSTATAADTDVRNPNQWATWRGPLMNGHAPTAKPPVVWSEEKNIRWKTALPGLGHSTPVIWNNRIFLTTAIPVGSPLSEPKPDLAPGAHDNFLVTNRYEFVALAIDRNDGTILWTNSLNTALPHEGGHYTSSLASHSPSVDSKHLIVSFGSHGIYGLDHDGGLIWKKDLGRMRSKHGHGEGSSPVLYDDTVVVNWDHQEQSFVVALDKSSGKEKWRVNRDELTSWASPIVVEVDDTPQAIVSGTQRVRGYDLSTGNSIWESSGLSANVVASPVAGNGIVIFGSSYEKQAMFAIRLDGAEGDMTASENVLWFRRRSTPYVPSPLLYDDVVYYLRHYQNILSRVDIESGRDEGGPFRLGELRNIYSSPVGADGRVYVTSREGLTIVISHAAEPELLAINPLSDRFSASAALVGNEMILRGEKFLYSIQGD